jgi:hypothetical protein
MMFLKEKRDGNIKGRACSDGRKQCKTAAPGDMVSLTVTVESVMITATVEAHEGRDVAVVDFPGAFLSADMDEEVIMTLRGRLAELMVKTARTYTENTLAWILTIDQSCTCYCRNHYMDSSEAPCYSIRNSSRTLIGRVSSSTGTMLKGIYGDMKVSRGKVHDYLGMTLDYTKKGEVKLTTIDYMKGVIEDFPEVITGVQKTCSGCSHIRAGSYWTKSGSGIPAHHRTTDVRLIKGTEGHTMCRRIPNNEGQVPRRG